MGNVLNNIAYMFYQTYVGPKCSYNTYMGRIKKRNLPMTEAISPNKVANKRRLPEIEFYHNYTGPKCGYWAYIYRLGIGLSREEAIKPWKKKAEFIRVHRASTYTPTYKERILSPRAVIDITLSSAEAEVFRKEYKRLKADLEHRLATCESPTLHLQLEHELEGLIEEIAVFNQRN